MPFRSCEEGGSDAELALALRRGHPGAALLLFDRHADMAARWLQRILGEEPGLASLVAAVFRRVLRGRKALGESGPDLAAIVLRATVREARRVLRRRRWQSLFDAPLRWRGSSRGREAGGQETVLAFYRALEMLGPDRRLAFCLGVMGDLSEAQIAEACGCSEGQARARLSSAIRRLSDRLETHCLDRQTAG